MKSSTINWLSRAIALPLFIAIAHTLPASAAPTVGVASQNENRSLISLGTAARNVESLPAVTDLNLAVPVPAKAIAPERPSAIQPIWSSPNRHNLAPKSSPERISKTSSIGKKNTALTSKLKSSLVLTAELQTKSKLTAKRNNLVATNSDTTYLKLTRKSRSNSKNIAAVSPSPLSSNSYLKLVKDPSKGTNELGNPIYTLEAYVDGQKYHTFDAVSGTANTQNADRNLGNNAAPLPDGSYEVSKAIVPGTVSEVGRTFVGIYPKFDTARTALGIHLDRSFNQRNGYDGTAGCIGITTAADRDAINEFISKYHPQNLIVKIAPTPDR
ncbi:hypothetical protein [Chamaesiphon sp. VAR_69_metabat_338]|uniref:hypothetical protein n=1 Tax=Chamaesiphon sp. VAR_69_metabat_338 TaxID=2964704 RepID=UPI00286E17DC|nr:hypothetical protein [Chamaesiphon sp. VAR_69_metabat_338]